MKYGAGSSFARSVWARCNSCATVASRMSLFFSAAAATIARIEISRAMELQNRDLRRSMPFIARVDPLLFADAKRCLEKVNYDAISPIWTGLVHRVHGYLSRTVQRCPASVPRGTLIGKPETRQR